MATLFDQLSMGEDALGTCNTPYISRRLYGCYVTSAAMLLTDFGHPVTPQALDEEWTRRGLYVSGCDAQDSDIPATEPSISAAGRFDYDGVAADLGKLPDGDPNLRAILQCDGNYLGLGYPTHYVYYVSGRGPVVINNPWGGHQQAWDAAFARRVITAIILFRHEAAPPAPASSFEGTIIAAGARVRTYPGLDAPVVQQPGAQPDIVDGGTVLEFKAWAHHAPSGRVTGFGGDVSVPLDYAFTPPRPDDRWFQTMRGNWISSTGVDYAGGADPPVNLLVADPAPPVAVPAPAPSPAPVPALTFRGDLTMLAGRWCWTWIEEGSQELSLGDFQHLLALGFDGVLIRAANGEGGSHDANFRARWASMAPRARAAGLKAQPWTYWYGPGDVGYNELDEARYLMTCADNTVAHPATQDPEVGGWVVDFEAKATNGVPLALRSLRERSGLAVFLNPYGDPKTVGQELDWQALDAVVDGYVPQFYTGAWQNTISLDQALAQWTSAQRPIYPVGDDQDVNRARYFVDWCGTRTHGLSAWRWGVLGDNVLEAYALPAAVNVPPPLTPPLPGPLPPLPAMPPEPPPAPPAGALDWLEAMLAWLRRLWR